MNQSFTIEEAVRKRYSVRNYADTPVSDEVRASLEAFVRTLDNPFGPKINFHFLDIAASVGGEKLGTYGVIKGARNYVGTTLRLGPLALEALGYEFETLVLYLASLDIGACWLGGTFDRQGFAEAMQIGDGEVFPIISPYGYAAEKKHLKELAMRKVIQADQRKEWDQLFFDGRFDRPLTQEAAGEYGKALEMVRLGPSASNKQPWRILRQNGAWHFYEAKSPGYSVAFPYDIQQIDLGIAAAHFHLAVLEDGLAGRFTQAEPEIELPDNMIYEFSWVPLQSD